VTACRKKALKLSNEGKPLLPHEDPGSVSYTDTLVKIPIRRPPNYNQAIRERVERFSKNILAGDVLETAFTMPRRKNMLGDLVGDYMQFIGTPESFHSLPKA
jgi:hypothetical protein